MGELSDRFGALMARIAATDAELFRTIGAQTAEFRKLVDEVLPDEGRTPDPAPLAVLSPHPLLPPEECSEKALRARFRAVAPALAFLEPHIGPPPTRRTTWKQVEQAFRQGCWPTPAASTPNCRRNVTTSDLQVLEARLIARIELLEERILDRLGL
jgi:hypothetical protein